MEVNRTVIMLLEDNLDRLREFEAAVPQLGASYRLRCWRDANRMMAECHEELAETALISLNDEVQVAAFFAKLPPVCPVILHTSNGERVWSMHNEFRFGGWEAERVTPLANDWIARNWLAMARALLEKALSGQNSYYQLQPDPDKAERFSRAVISLHGLAIGDGIGEMMFGRPDPAIIGKRLRPRRQLAAMLTPTAPLSAASLRCPQAGLGFRRNGYDR